MGLAAIESAASALGRRYIDISRFRSDSLATGGAAAASDDASGDMLREFARIGLIPNHKLRFSFDDRLNDVVVKVIDGETDKVIREIPPEELRNLHIRLREAIGILLDETA
jgi:flagellar protein FlaG